MVPGSWVIDCLLILHPSLEWLLSFSFLRLLFPCLLLFVKLFELGFPDFPPIGTTLHPTWFINISIIIGVILPCLYLILDHLDLIKIFLLIPSIHRGRFIYLGTSTLGTVLILIHIVVLDPLTWGKHDLILLLWGLVSGKDVISWHGALLSILICI